MEKAPAQPIGETKPFVVTASHSAVGYLLSLARPVVRGKAPLVYTLARKGLNYLKGAGFDVRVYFRPSKEQEKSYLFLLHTLAINDVLIAASNLHKVAAEYSLQSFIHERVLKQTPYKITIWLRMISRFRFFE